MLLGSLGCEGDLELPDGGHVVGRAFSGNVSAVSGSRITGFASLGWVRQRGPDGAMSAEAAVAAPARAGLPF